MQTSYDLIVVGGGIGGSVIAKAMAEHGASVLLLERTSKFLDRVRGDQISPWGVAEAKALGIYELLANSCGHNLPWFDNYSGGVKVRHRDLLTTTPHKAPILALYHPEMQEVLLQSAIDAGADVVRGAVVREVNQGQTPNVVAMHGSQLQEYTARLVIGADGRNSTVRQSAGFQVKHDQPKRFITGFLFKDMSIPDDSTSSLFSCAGTGRSCLLFPLGRGRVRVYLVHPQASSRRLQGTDDISVLIDGLVNEGVPAEYFNGAHADGPLATFNGADSWVEYPYKDGIVLIGDAAAANDPSFGCGLSLTLRDVRVLRDHLMQQDDWEVAVRSYCEEHKQYYGTLHAVTQWSGQLFLEIGPEADAIRARALPLMASDSTRQLDHILCGPDKSVNERTRRRFFGEE